MQQVGAAPNEQLGDFAAPNQGGSAKPDLKGVGDQPLPLLRVSHIDLRTKEHKTINIPGQRAGTLLLMFRHFARIGHHAGDAKKVSKKTRPKRMSYAGLEEFVKHWLEPKDLCSCSEDLPQMWQAVISNKMKEEGAQNHLDYFGPHDFTVFLMVAILAYKSKMRLVSTPRATRVFVEALCLELRPQLLQRLRNHYQAFTRPELGHYHEEVLLSETAKSPTQAPARPGDASPRHNVLHIRNFARDMAVAGELNRRFMYAVVTKEEAAWHHNSGILRLLQRDSRFHPAIMMKDIPAIQHVDLSFGVEIGKTYHVRFDILLSRPSEAVAAEDEADDYDPNDSAAAAAALADALQTHRQEFQLALSPKGNAAALRASVQSVQQISCIPAPASTTSANGMAGQGEDVELRLIITIRPTCAGIFTGNIDLQLIEGAGHNIDFKYKLPPVPYFVNVRHPGVRRPAKTAMAPTFTAGKQALPIIHNPRGGPGFSKAADFSRISKCVRLFAVVFAFLFQMLIKHVCVSTLLRRPNYFSILAE
eukprot:INCI15504.1.p1 GENE.INCI15504.1~~INCI15504.1.p1  ORF type:complete len:533 (+),score=84.44 INCI15504.1:382-1980(+)